MDVLIVSRSERARGWLRAALDPTWNIEEASNGLEAVRLAREEGYDLVIADETTEPFGAFGLSRELKILPEAPAVLILLERAQDTWLAKWSGADKWLKQPLDPFAVEQAAREAVEEQEATMAGPHGPAPNEAAATDASA